MVVSIRIPSPTPWVTPKKINKKLKSTYVLVNNPSLTQDFWHSCWNFKEFSGGNWVMPYFPTTSCRGMLSIAHGMFVSMPIGTLLWAKTSGFNWAHTMDLNVVRFLALPGYRVSLARKEYMTSTAYVRGRFFPAQWIRGISIQYCSEKCNRREKSLEKSLPGYYRIWKQRGCIKLQILDWNNWLNKLRNMKLAV